MTPCRRCGDRPKIDGKGETLCITCKGHCRECGSETKPRGAKGLHPPLCNACRQKTRRKVCWTCQRCGGPAPREHKLCLACDATPLPCSRCGGQKDGPHASYCRECYRAYSREWPTRSPDKYRLKTRRRMLMKAYGMTPQDFDTLLASQGEVCAGCGIGDVPVVRKSKHGMRGNLHVDHCHATGMVRGILCASCNNALGRVKDNPDTLRRLADYLERTRK